MSSPSVQQALSLAADGQIDRASALLHAAGEQGSADAWMQLAVWHLIGAPLPRDLDKARLHLARAVASGHVDGALMEIALTANGNGGHLPADWQAARAALAEAARTDHVAAAQVTLLDRMALASDGGPLNTPAGRPVRADPRVEHFPGFLTRDECAHIAGAAQALLAPSFVLDPNSGRPIPHPIRTSDGGAIGPTNEDLVIRAINLRIAAATGTAVDQGESLTVLRYARGQEYRRHLDTIAGAANQRIATFIIYLNEGFEGGETHFPLLNIQVRPRVGDAIRFDTVQADGMPDQRLVHTGQPVRNGVKWIATRWMRQTPVDPWTIAAG